VNIDGNMRSNVLGLQLIHSEAEPYRALARDSNSNTPIVIIGAGPYGLSIAAHLRAQKLNFRIFGRIMSSWREQMPDGMNLKSEGFASNLSAPGAGLSLERFCKENGYVYPNYGVPVSLKVFCAYGAAFQKEFAPEVDERAVASVSRTNDGFSVKLEEGATFFASKVIVTVGLSYFAKMPPNLAHLPPSIASHSSDHHQLERFSGRDVTIVGAGASALDLAALLQMAGATVRLVARAQSLKWNAHIVRRSLWRRWYPMSGLGGGWRNRFYENGPMLFRLLPAEVRRRIVRTWLGPSGSYSVKDRVLASVSLLLGHDIQYAETQDGKALLHLVDRDKRRSELMTDHVIAATGYSVRLGALPFLDTELQSEVRTIDGSPELTADFESSVKGLYFIGVMSAITFGPLMRFVLGTDYTARRLTRHMVRDASRISMDVAASKRAFGVART
jgi:thioredoxin reductase